MFMSYVNIIPPTFVANKRYIIRRIFSINLQCLWRFLANSSENSITSGKFPFDLIQLTVKSAMSCILDRPVE